MTFLELVSKRKSERKYSSRIVEQYKLEYLIECARQAPSAVNYQPWYFYLVSEGEVKQHIIDSYPREWFAAAPVYIVACSNTKESWKRTVDAKDFADIDVTIAVEHICLAATELGLGSCWVCNFNPQLCAEALNLPVHMVPVVIIPIGYPVEEGDRKSTRKPLVEICEYRE